MSKNKLELKKGIYAKMFRNCRFRKSVDCYEDFYNGNHLLPKELQASRKVYPCTVNHCPRIPKELK